MDFVHYDLGQLGPGQVVEVTLNIAANVQLLDTSNFNLYRSGGSFRYFGGHKTSSRPTQCPRRGTGISSSTSAGHPGTPVLPR